MLSIITVHRSFASSLTNKSTNMHLSDFDQYMIEHIEAPEKTLKHMNKLAQKVHSCARWWTRSSKASAQRVPRPGTIPKNLLQSADFVGKRCQKKFDMLTCQCWCPELLQPKASSVFHANDIHRCPYCQWTHPAFRLRFHDGLCLFAFGLRPCFRAFSGGDKPLDEMERTSCYRDDPGILRV